MVAVVLLSAVALLLVLAVALRRPTKDKAGWTDGDHWQGKDRKR